MVATDDLEVSVILVLLVVEKIDMFEQPLLMMLELSHCWDSLTVTAMSGTKNFSVPAEQEPVAQISRISIW